MLIARTDALGAVGGNLDEAIWRTRALRRRRRRPGRVRAVEHARGPAEPFAETMRTSHYSSAFPWQRDPAPSTFRELPELGLRFIFVTLSGDPAVWNAIEDLVAREEAAQWALEKRKLGHPTESPHVLARLPHFQALEREQVPPALGPRRALR